MSINQEKNHGAHMAASREDPDANMSAGQYLASRFSTLKPPMDKVISPLAAMRMLNKEQWTFFMASQSINHQKRL